MVNETRRDPTVQEIVVALRETQGRSATRPRSAPASIGPAAGFDDNLRHRGPPVDVRTLRETEFQRLLDENHLLNERIVELLNMVERERQAREDDRAHMEKISHRLQQQKAMRDDVRNTIEDELRPVLAAVLKLLERKGSAATRAAAAAAATAAGRSDASVGVSAARQARDERMRREMLAEGADADVSGWLLELIRRAEQPADGSAELEKPGASPYGEPMSPRKSKRGLIPRVLDKLGLL
ncbi:MAG: hypothetical protein JWL84_6198 [Rhodospirillales bacterium]|jgi:TolA-binding protein|nr:hypothetical protein [Rhodospirillales bacterium]